MRIIQLLTTLAFGDAVSNDCLAIYELLSRCGIKTAIYAENIDRKLQSLPNVKPFSRLGRLSSDDIVLYRLSTGTALNRMIRGLGGRKFIIYHNTTPPEYFYGYSGRTASLCSDGIAQTAELKDVFEGGFCDSDYNRRVLLEMGYKCPLAVRPILIPFDDYDNVLRKEVPEDSAELSRIFAATPERRNILFVGRIAPNKKQEDLISMVYAYKQLYDDKVRLILAGNPSGLEKYNEKLRDYASALGLDEEEILFTGQISFRAIVDCYKAADCFVSMSEHEGFCVPLVEAMYFDLPLLAYDSSAVGETAGDAGILLSEKDPAVAAAYVHEILNNNRLRETMIKEQRERLKYFEYENVSRIFMEEFERMTGISLSPDGADIKIRNKE